MQWLQTYKPSRLSSGGVGRVRAGTFPLLAHFRVWAISLEPPAEAGVNWAARRACAGIFTGPVLRDVNARRPLLTCGVLVGGSACGLSLGYAVVTVLPSLPQTPVSAVAGQVATAKPPVQGSFSPGRRERFVGSLGPRARAAKRSDVDGVQARRDEVSEGGLGLDVVSGGRAVVGSPPTRTCDRAGPEPRRWRGTGRRGRRCRR
jgi:hypothetical protein